ncbi:MAG: hypothetical protein Q4D02_07235 [Clostridia bacterium]|nr:hypothetical protein [Clostridia bacterium]
MNSCEIVSLISAISCAIAKGRTTDELNILSAIFTQIGDSLTTIAVTRTTSNTTDNNIHSC